MTIFFHEQLYRTPELMTRMRDFPVAICGAGALGANITETLARSGFGCLNIIDRDRVEERNLSTQPYYQSDIGAYKAKILANSLYRALGIAINAQTKELTASNCSSLLKESHLIVETFDNSTSRQIIKDHCHANTLPCLHVGLASDYAEIIWNDNYRVPSPANDDICDYPLARNLVLLTVAVACEAIAEFVATERQCSYTVTLKDLRIEPFA
ncbi:ThiF family adenylyltransferase [Lusitaniella coriacea LEGE 07157]|uniref:ThiF family adenylyltransferase n=1 Tax=Lusitaniella coriacea LEGE 07157 TaxID=945747 RepID=A0A8J7DWA6_9CYAN|nr:ThiF family adenylyltransferase [Lusitaniella coriacea]MBE9116213.1 ThiF family adenylyltransferase [Lusitaniella coriacea LEGE 07157]